MASSHAAIALGRGTDSRIILFDLNPRAEGEMVDVTKTLHKALRTLEADRGRVRGQIVALEQALRAVDGRQASRGGRSVGTRPRKRRPMSPAARKAVSRRMKAYWAKRRRARAKGSAVKK
jgi:hypothetical protein